jgi:hypothetical protein
MSDADEFVFEPAELLGSDATQPSAVDAVEANAAVPATFANVRLDIFLLI